LDTISIKTNTNVETEIQKNNSKGHQYDLITYNLEFHCFPILFHSTDFLHNTAALKKKNQSHNYIIEVKRKRKKNAKIIAYKVHSNGTDVTIQI